MLIDQKVKSFVVTADVGAAKKFYGEVLGFQFLSEDDYGLTFGMHHCLLRISLTNADNAAPQKNTVLGWTVPDIEATLSYLKSKGVMFEKYTFLQQNENSIWHAPDGTKVAWFKDPNGNVLSIDQQG